MSVAPNPDKPGQKAADDVSARGHRADEHVLRTEGVAGVQEMRFQEPMPDVLHGLGIRQIHRWVSMSNDIDNAITGSMPSDADLARIKGRSLE